MGVRHFLKKLFQNEPGREPEDIEHVRIDFKARYHHFKLLLNANNRALDIMAGMEKALYGNHPFGMSFIRSNCTAVSVNVFRMIKNIEELSGGKYTLLFSRFDDIQKKIDGILKDRKTSTDDRLVIGLEDIDASLSDVVGNKMAHLGQVKNKIHLPVPEGFVVTATAYAKFMETNEIQPEIDRRLQTADPEDMEELYSLSAQMQQMVIGAKIPEDLAQAVKNAFARMKEKVGGPVNVAVRSSALGEDAIENAFAGQYRTELNVSEENFFEAYKNIVASKYSLQAMTYRLNKGIKDEDVAMSVGCLMMIEARTGGVTYSRNPVNRTDGSVFINAAWGLPKSVVDGSVDCDIFVVAKEPEPVLIRQEIKDKTVRFSCDAEEGVCREEITEDGLRKSASLNHGQVMALAQQAMIVEDHYGMPQDIEWAITEKGDIIVLQARPLFQAGEFTDALTVIHDPETLIFSGGTTASPGVAEGPVYQVDKGSDVFQFPKGAVLVVRQALPRWASLLSRASAVVSEQGGFAGHLANVAREFNIPALFGIKDVMEKLPTGTQITVDANGGSVYRGHVKRNTLPVAQKKIMIGTPVHETLEKVSRYIVPLHLRDPDARDFTPSGCTTFHDITRFIHEKSVSEMFNFGKTHNFSERSSKQLYYKVPMQWWILNLDDGFAEEVAGKYVKLDNIISIPMLAFWDGFAAIPWDGPPAIDGRGLMSVMFHATTNPALNTGLRTKYSERNYFMISKHYLSLNSRLGFHFSTLEALVSDRPQENYVSFQFKGGAADQDRRFKRVIFIGDLLEKYDFRVDRKADSLIARVEHQEKQVMMDRLKILGYLTLHTRQLDMIMASPERVAFYQSKLLADIGKIIH